MVHRCSHLSAEPTTEAPSHLCSALHLPPEGSTQGALASVALTNPKGHSLSLRPARAWPHKGRSSGHNGNYPGADHHPPLEAAPSTALATQTCPSNCFPPTPPVFTAPAQPPAEALVVHSQDTGLKATEPVTFCVTLGKWPHLSESWCLLWKMSHNNSCPDVCSEGYVRAHRESGGQPEG